MDRDCTLPSSSSKHVPDVVCGLEARGRFRGGEGVIITFRYNKVDRFLTLV